MPSNRKSSKTNIITLCTTVNHLKHIITLCTTVNNLQLYKNYKTCVLKHVFCNMCLCLPVAVCSRGAAGKNKMFRYESSTAT